jgi:hypothetical protein
LPRERYEESTNRRFNMLGRSLRRLLVLAAAPVIAALGTLGWAGPAYAHTVNSINVNCETVTVDFSGFPAEGVTVHIGATVEGHGSVGTDVLVKGSMTGTLDISGETSTLFGAPAKVDVDVTWNFQGAQHLSDSGTVTCGTATTTIAPTTTTAAPTTTLAPTTTVAPTTTTTVAPTTTVSPTTTAAPTTTFVAVGGNTHSNTSGGASATVGATPGSVAVEGASAGMTPSGAVSATGTQSTSGSGGPLPFTGSAAMPLLAFGLASIGAGTAAILRTRLRRS